MSKRAASFVTSIMPSCAVASDCQLEARTMLKVAAMQSFFSHQICALVLALAAFTLGGNGSAHSDLIKYSEIPNCDSPFGLCGYIDTETRQLIIPRKFERAMYFSEDLAAVRVEGQFDYINRNGDVVIEPQFELAGRFSNGLAEVIVDGHAGVIDRNGNFVLEPRFSIAIPFTRDVLLASADPEHGVANETRVYPEDDSRRLHSLSARSGLPRSDALGLYHLNDSWLSDERFAFRSFDTPGSDLIWARKDRKSLWGLMRSDGRWAIEPKFEHVDMLINGRAVVGADLLHMGTLDQTGLLVIPMKFERVGNFANGVAKHFSYGGMTPMELRGEIRRLRKLGLQEELPKPEVGVVDMWGNLIGDRYFEKVRFRSNHTAAFQGDATARVWRDGRWIGLLANGDLVEDPLNGQLAFECPTGLHGKHTQGGIQVPGQDGEALTDVLFYRAEPWSKDCAELVSLRLEKTGSLITRNGKWITGSPNIQGTSLWSDGHAQFRVNDLWGLLRSDGQIVVPATYSQIGPLIAGAYKAVKQDGQEIWIDNQGNAVGKPGPSSLAAEWFNVCKKGGRLTPHDGLWGLADDTGAFLIEPEHTAMTCFHQGIAWVPVEQAQAWCAIYPDGSVDPARCLQNFTPLGEGFYRDIAEPEYQFGAVVQRTRELLEVGAGLRDDWPGQ